MKCQELDQFLYPYLDGEFDGPEREHLESHLADCAACAERVEVEAAFQSAIRERSRPPPGAMIAPASLRSAVTLGLRKEGRREQMFSWMRWSAAAMVAATVGTTYLHYRQSPRDRLIEDAALRHARRLPSEVQGLSHDALEAWFDGKLAYRVPVPRLAHAQIRGGRLSNVTDRDAAYIVYEAQDPGTQEPRRVSVFVLDDSDEAVTASPWPRVEFREVHGYRVATWRNGPIAYELVTDLDEEAVRRLLATDIEPPPQALAKVNPAIAGQVIPASLHP